MGETLYCRVSVVYKERRKLRLKVDEVGFAIFELASEERGSLMVGYLVGE